MLRKIEKVSSLSLTPSGWNEFLVPLRGSKLPSSEYYDGSLEDSEDCENCRILLASHQRSRLSWDNSRR